MFKQIDYTMVIVSDMARSVEFYRDKLGIPLKVSVTRLDRVSHRNNNSGLARRWHSRQTRGGPADKDAGTCSIGFNVDDVDKTYEELKARGINFGAAANAERR